MSPAKRDWSGCNTEAGGVVLLESILDPLPLQAVDEVVVEPSEVAECGCGCVRVLFPPSSCFNLWFFSTFLFLLFKYQYYSLVNDRLRGQEMTDLLENEIKWKLPVFA